MKVLNECQVCHVVAEGELCEPSPVYDMCLDHTAQQPQQEAPVCEQIQRETLYECSVCERPSPEPLNLCYPRKM
ncbi:MAG: hypothetical protein ABI333_00430 [bacterium]